MTSQVLIARTGRRIVPSRKRRNGVTGQPLFDSPVGGTTIPPFGVTKQSAPFRGNSRAIVKEEETMKPQMIYSAAATLGPFLDADPVFAARRTGKRRYEPTRDSSSDHTSVVARGAHSARI